MLIMKQLKIDIANNIGISSHGDVLLAKFMHSITIIRNLCAHGSRLYNRLFEQKPSLNKEEKKAFESTQESDNLKATPAAKRKIFETFRGYYN